MAARNSHTRCDYSNERTNERSVKEKQTSKNERTNEGFKVQNNNDFNVCSDVENVLNLNPVSYIDHVKSAKKEDIEGDTKTCHIKETHYKPTSSLINIDKIEPPSVSTIVKAAAHIIGPPPPSKPTQPVKKRQRRDDSDKNYKETVALNEEVIDLFGDKKKVDARSVSKPVYQYTVYDKYSSI